MKAVKVSLQIKILGLVLLFGFFLIVLLTGYFSYKESNQIEENRGRLALELAKSISFMPSVIEAFDTDDPAKTIQPLAEKIRKSTGAEFIVVGNRQGIRYSHPVPSEIGKKMKGGDNKRALQGKYYVSRAKGSLGPSLRGKAPIYNKQGEIIGLVSVGFLLEDINEQITNNLQKVLVVSFLALIVSIIGSFMLSRNIRKDTMGLEPYEIAALYKEKNAVYHSVKEGILAIKKDGRITNMNQPAKRLLNIEGSVRNMKVDGLFPSDYLYEVMQHGSPEPDKEMYWKGQTVIVNCTPLRNESGEITGVVASFRDKTEIEQMVNTLSEVKQYSDDLRSQTHEYTNKLYVLYGLLQLGEYEEAIDMIKNETTLLQLQHSVVFRQIQDTKVQAILLGKLAKASEKKIQFEIAPDSTLEVLPQHIKLSNLIVILGNIIDNAFDAVSGMESPAVKLFVTDIGSDIIFEVEDNGTGIGEKEIPQLFNRGYTSKTGSKPRGYGLANADEAVKELNGIIEVHSQPENGTVFTVYLPKNNQGS
ncbi:ATPase [Fictibacillus enclensis]|uniref:histidine kinase n=1 Tax=Fictibacillus enclensis TaxID=1017270 RepID=A0A0V8J1K1_9BACL|nr:sensor histidine kinase [Fictibacillus enclensis]KSU80977.1 ATPase [Fictibacillus enclensis]